jgi:hypothetical protein
MKGMHGRLPHVGSDRSTSPSVRDSGVGDLVSGEGLGVDVGRRGGLPLRCVFGARAGPRNWAADPEWDT